MLGTIGLFLQATDNDYQLRLKEVGLREAKRQGFDLVIESAQNDPQRQVAQIEKAIQSASTSNTVALLVSRVRDEPLVPLVRVAAEADLAFALLNEGTFIDEARNQTPNRPIFMVTAEQIEIGRIHGQQIRSLVDSPASVLCVTGPLSTLSAQRRLQGLKEVLPKDYTLIELQADWTSEGARMAVERWAASLGRNPELPRIIVAHNDEMALGVRQALRDVTSQQNLPQVKAYIIGCDGSQTFGQRLVRESRIKATVIMPPASAVAIEWIARFRTRGELPPVRVVQPVTPFPALSSLRR
jgi:ABC-type sugar transport system substrate-binding protein